MTHTANGLRRLFVGVNDHALERTFKFIDATWEDIDGDPVADTLVLPPRQALPQFGQ